MVDSFKMYTDEESVELKKYFTNALTNMDSIIKKFMEKYIKHPKLQPEIKKLIQAHSISFNKKKMKSLYQLIEESSIVNKEEIESKKEKSEMYQKRSEEYNKIKDFVNVNYLKMLPDQEIINSNSGKQDNKNHEKNNSISKANSKQQSIKCNEEITHNKNILICPIESETSNNYNNLKVTKEEEINKDDDDDIKIETIYTGKKRKRDKDKGINPSNSNIKKQGVAFTFCYICKAKFNNENNHSFYSNLCKACGDYNYSFRVMKLDFNGRIAVVTGGRVKIGYYIATKLLEYGCKVILTSRFPKDCLSKYQTHPQYLDWKANLLIYPIDFRLFESTVKFITFLNENFPHIDILINNAAQTIRRTTSYYKYLLPIETKALNPEDERKIIKNDFINLSKQLEAPIQSQNQNEAKDALVSISQTIEDKSILPLSVIASQIRIMEEKDQPNKTLISQDQQPIDFSKGKSSWNMELDEVPFQEFTEVQIINTWTPYYLCVKLNPLMKKSPFPDKYIVNVSSVEGLFNHFKRTTHPHTNMAKAALNMLTRTCGQYYKSFGIYMTSVDTGWVSPMNEFNSMLDSNKIDSFEKEYCNIPLDELDGAMRVLYPIIEGIKNKNYIYGHMLKDYAKANW